MTENNCEYCKKLEHELEEHRDEMSGHDKSDKKSELNKLEQKKKTAQHNRRKKIKYGSVLGILGLLLVGGGFFAAQNADSLGPTTNSSIGVGEPVHWHADYTISVCGENKVPRGGPMLAHTHGETRFHLEGVRKNRDQATLGWVLEQLGVKMSEGSLYGETSCGGESANLTVKANGDTLQSPEDYIVRDGDSISIELS